MLPPVNPTQVSFPEPEIKGSELTPGGVRIRIKSSCVARSRGVLGRFFHLGLAGVCVARSISVWLEVALFSTVFRCGLAGNPGAGCHGEGADCRGDGLRVALCGR